MAKGTGLTTMSAASIRLQLGWRLAKTHKTQESLPSRLSLVFVFVSKTQLGGVMLATG